MGRDDEDRSLADAAGALCITQPDASPNPWRTSPEPDLPRWNQGNSEQILYIYFEDHITELAYPRPMLEALVDAALQREGWGPDKLFTTEDLDDFAERHHGGWPSTRQLLALGKRLLLFNDAPEHVRAM